MINYNYLLKRSHDTPCMSALHRRGIRELKDNSTHMKHGPWNVAKAMCNAMHTVL